MIDLEQVERGWTLHFRSGGQIKVDKIELRNVSSNLYNIWDNANQPPILWWKNGQFGTGHHFLDIVKVEPPPFDWGTIKNGMAFRFKTGKLVFYIGVNPHTNKAVFATYANGTLQLPSGILHELRRSPLSDLHGASLIKELIGKHTADEDDEEYDGDGYEG